MNSSVPKLYQFALYNVQMAEEDNDREFWSSDPHMVHSIGHNTTHSRVCTLPSESVQGGCFSLRGCNQENAPNIVLKQATLHIMYG